jgi:hypothetical protein
MFTNIKADAKAATLEGNRRGHSLAANAMSDKLQGRSNRGASKSQGKSISSTCS